MKNTLWRGIIATLLFASATGRAATPLEDLRAPLSFDRRCADPGVVLCDDLDDTPVKGIAIGPRTRNRTLPEALQGKYGEWRWCTHSPKKLPVPPVIDRRTRSSGSGSLRLTVADGSADDGAGYCQMNFSPDNSVQFGEGERFFVQFKVRYDCVLLFEDCDPASPAYKLRRRKFKANGGGFTALKLSIINTGDNAAMQSPAGSCSNQHLVLIVDGRGVVQGYHSCEWFDSQRGDLGLDPRTGRVMFDLQPKAGHRAHLNDICHHSDSPAAPRDDPTRGCVLMPADEWVTVTQQISIGTYTNRLNDPARNSNLKLWIARAGQAPRLVFDYDRNLQRPEKPYMKYGKIWLLPYITNKDPKAPHPSGSVWYDELIISRSPIAPAK